MHIQINPTRLHGKVLAPPSKSYSHRWLIAAALADTPTEIKGLSHAKDIHMTITALRALGAKVEGDTVYPARPSKTALMLCGESGTTLRLLLPVTAMLGVEARFIATGRLPSRPLGPLTDMMQAHGVLFDKTTLPFTISGKMTSGQYSLPGNISSQFISGLLFALPMLDSGSVLHLTTPLESAAYVDMTLEVLDRFGVFATIRDDGFLLPGSQRYRSPGRISVEGDWSSAAFFLVAGAIGGSIALEGLAADSLQGDSAIVDILRQFGANVSIDNGSIKVEGGDLHGQLLDVSGIPDLVPALAVLAAASKGTTRLENAARLRLKESDRLESTAAMLRAFGARVEVEPNALVIHGGTPLHGGEVDSFGDHRIAMAAAIAASIAQGQTIIRGAEVVDKSYPGFFRVYSNAGGKGNVLNDG